MRTLFRDSVQRLVSFEQFQLILLANIIGVAAGFLVILYRQLINSLRILAVDVIPRFLDMHAGHGKYVVSEQGLYLILIPVVGGGLIALINYYFTRDADSAYGVPGVMEALTMRGARIPLRVVAARAMAAAVTIGAGGAAGKQGSISQMGLELANIFRRVFKIGEQKLRILAMSGVAAMLAANYNAPLAGIVMVFEVIIGEFNPSYLGLIAVPVVIANLIYTAVVGNHSKFPSPVFPAGSVAQLPLYLFVGVATGLLGIVYIKVINNSEHLFERIFARTNYFVRPLVGGLGMGVVVFLVPLAFGRGTEGIDLALAGRLAPAMMLLLILLKLVNISFTVGAWRTGGGFRAGLFMGTMLGGTLGYVFHSLFPGIVNSGNAATYALIGMGGIFASAAQAPFTAIMFAIELTRNFGVVIPVAASCATAAYISKALSDESMFTGRFIRLGLDVDNARREDILRNILVRDAMVRDVATVPASLSVKEAFRHANQGAYTGYPVVDDEGRLVGIVTLKGLRNALREGLHNSPVSGVLPRRLAVVTPRDTLRDAMVRLNEHGIKRLLVVARDDATRLVGLLTMADIMNAYNDDLAKVARRNRLAEAARARKRRSPPGDGDSPSMAITTTETGMAECGFQSREGILDPSSVSDVAAGFDGSPTLQAAARTER